MTGSWNGTERNKTVFQFICLIFLLGMLQIYDGPEIICRDLYNFAYKILWTSFCKHSI